MAQCSNETSAEVWTIRFALRNNISGEIANGAAVTGSVDEGYRKLVYSKQQYWPLNLAPEKFWKADKRKSTRVPL